MVSLEQLLEVYGYPALFAGTFVEGETPLLMAGFLAHRGYLHLPLVMLVAFAGSFSSDQLFFYLGRTRGRRYLAERPSWQPKAERVSALLDRYGIPLVIGFRFLYGLRTATPFVVGMSGFDPFRFVLLNAAGGVVWSCTLATAGYALGGLLAAFFSDVRRYEVAILAGMLAVSAMVWLFHVWRRSRTRRRRET